MGNAFACKARDRDEVWQKIKESKYYITVWLSQLPKGKEPTNEHDQGVWDTSTAHISPLETVHSGDFDSSREV